MIQNWEKMFFVRKTGNGILLIVRMCIWGTILLMQSIGGTAQVEIMEPDRKKCATGCWTRAIIDLNMAPSIRREVEPRPLAILIQYKEDDKDMNQTRRPDLPDSLRSEIDNLMRQSGETRRGGDGPASLLLSEESWSIIPEPKRDWDFYPQVIANAVVETIVEREGCDVLDLWLDRFYDVYFDPERKDSYTNMVAGHALYRCGREAEGIALFERVYQDYGAGLFTGFYAPYLDLVKSN